ncbi:hypothetical protein [Chroococcus sp. FPU101]|uniref:hypothetical protein n=1 Tax=Chroococcus sp. FPU101 TaxID=1974212 RepID=UPI001A903114|nr:hypothetical protein [Chroococcus sp. FPU101]GFE71863.1 hypothetical protein CFPU101_44730 [Chroococcus sp. FPU101]
MIRFENNIWYTDTEFCEKYSFSKTQLLSLFRQNRLMKHEIRYVEIRKQRYYRKMGINQQFGT